MDATAAFEEQDLRIADLIEREGRALVIGMNKWDLKEGEGAAAAKLRSEVDHWLPQVKGVPIVAVSGLTGQGLDRLMQAVIDIHAVWNRRVSTNALNRWLDHALSAPSAAGGVGTPPQAQLHHPAQGATTELRRCSAPARTQCRTPTSAISSTGCARASTCPACRSG